MNVLTPTSQQHVEETLINDGVISKEKLEEIKEKAKAGNEPFFSLLVNEGHVSDEELTKALATVSNIPYVNLSVARIDPKTLDLLSQEIATHYMAVPLGKMQNRLVVAMLDADNVQAVDFLSNKIGKPLKVYAASESGIRRVLGQYARALEKGVTSMLAKTPDVVEKTYEERKEERNQEAKPAENVKTIVQDSPISKALAAIMDYAGKNNASDIHMEPTEDEFKIRCRIDGVLHEVMKLPKSTEAPLVSRIKILSNLKIDEHRVPQDGNFSIMVDNRPIDLRIAISPVVWGEQVVIRLLDKTGTSLKLEDMGYAGRALRSIRKALKQPYGMILTSGPTGSGKSTSMYAMLQEIKSESINIVTLEDPVEYKIGGINQIQVNADVGLTFATGLRSILRQDPNVIMVGEIRDKDMAKLAEDIGYKTLPLATDNAYTLFKGKTNPDNQTGYQGRMGLYEVFEVTEAIQDQILKHSTSAAIQKAAQSEGMVTMRQDGYLKALAGKTTLMEVDRVASSEA
jgi:type IV pilus assembly protein PilB